MRKLNGTTPAAPWWVRGHDQDGPPVIAVGDGQSWQTERPARAASLIADLAVPLAQAAVTGALLAGLAVFVLWELAPGLDGEPGKVWLGLTLAISGAVWVLLLGQHRRLLWSIESVIGRDLDGDGKKGRPEVYTEQLSVSMAGAQGERLGEIDTAALGWDRTGLIRFAKATVKVGVFTEARWAKSQEFHNSPTLFRAVMAELERLGILEKDGTGKRATRRLTARGRQLFEQLAALPERGN